MSQVPVSVERTISRVERRRFDSGFTLLELLIVIVVLGVLSAVVIFGLGGISSSATVSACNSDAHTVAEAVQIYTHEHGGTFPSALSDLTAGAEPLLQSLPSSPNYAISLDSLNRSVLVTAPMADGTPKLWNDAGACDGASEGSDAVTTTPSVDVTTTTGAVAPTSTTSVPPTTIASTTTTTLPPTTTTLPPTTTTLANVVTVDATSSNAAKGFDELTITNTAVLTSMTVHIYVIETTGLVTSGISDTFPGGAVSTGRESSQGVETYTFTLKPNKTIGARTSNAVGKFTLRPAGRSTSGDSWDISFTANGDSSTQSGGF